MASSYIKSEMEGNVSCCLEKSNDLKILVEGKTKLLQIGFNAGHSADILLNGNKESTLVSFDIGEHDYVLNYNRYIQSKYASRHTLIIGDSLYTLPAFTEKHEGEFDLIFVDGGHSYEVATSDLKFALKLASKDGLIIVDDVIHEEEYKRFYSPGPTKAWEEQKSNLYGCISRDYGPGQGMSYGFKN